MLTGGGVPSATKVSTNMAAEHPNANAVTTNLETFKKLKGMSLLTEGMWRARNSMGAMIKITKGGNQLMAVLRKQGEKSGVSVSQVWLRIHSSDSQKSSVNQPILEGFVIQIGTRKKFLFYLVLKMNVKE